MGGSTRRLVPLAHDESLRLLGTLPYGRVVHSRRALPAITPVRHLVHRGSVVIRGEGASAIVPAESGRGETVLAYQADDIDARSLLGWSVVVTGVARLVAEPDELAWYEARLRPWVAGSTGQIIRIVPELVNGFRLVDDAVDSVDGVDGVDSGAT